MKYKIGSAYLVILGIFTLIFGILNVTFALIGKEFLISSFVIHGSMWSLWKGFILIFAGAFTITGSLNLKNVHGLAKAVLGSVMLWIVAGCNIFSKITGSIPGEETWFKTLEGFLESYAPPYQPEIWLLPFSLVVLYFVAESSDRDNKRFSEG